MQKTLSGIVKIIGAAACISMTAPVFAESAPVYDADAVQQDDSAGDQGQYLPPPPAPEASAAQDAGSTFVPVQSNVASAAPATSPQSLSMDQRMQRLEQQVNNMQGSDAAQRIDSLQAQVQALRGQVELLTHQLEQLVKKPTAANTNAADGTVTADNSDANNLPVATPTLAKTADNKPVKPIVIKTSKKQTVSSESNGQPNIAEEQQIYQTAYNLIKARRYTEAVTALQGMLKKYPSGQFASNAHYWLGELYGLMGKNDQALDEFRTVVDNYADSPRVSDAQLKVGLLLASQLKWPEAKSALRRVITQYPGSASARLAAEQLKQIKIAGH
jgi:tol-pal system protein YbgF